MSPMLAEIIIKGSSQTELIYPKFYFFPGSVYLFSFYLLESKAMELETNSYLMCC